MHRPRHARAFGPVKRLVHERSCTNTHRSPKLAKCASSSSVPSPARALPVHAGAHPRQAGQADTSVNRTPIKCTTPIAHKGALTPRSRPTVQHRLRSTPKDASPFIHCSPATSARQDGPASGHARDTGAGRVHAIQTERSAEERRIKFRVVPINLVGGETNVDHGVSTVGARAAKAEKQTSGGADGEDVFGSTCTPVRRRKGATGKEREGNRKGDVRVDSATARQAGTGAYGGAVGGSGLSVSSGGPDMRYTAGWVTPQALELSARRSIRPLRGSNDVAASPTAMLSGCIPSSREAFSLMGNHGGAWPLAGKPPSLSLIPRHVAIRQQSVPVEGQFEDADSPARIQLSFASASTAAPQVVKAPSTPRAAGVVEAGDPHRAPVHVDARALPSSAFDPQPSIALEPRARLQNPMHDVAPTSDTGPFRPAEGDGSPGLDKVYHGQVTNRIAAHVRLGAATEPCEEEHEGAIMAKRRKLSPSASTRVDDIRGSQAERCIQVQPKVSDEGTDEKAATDMQAGIRREYPRLRPQASISALIHAVGLGLPLPTSARPAPFPTPARTAQLPPSLGQMSGTGTAVARYSQFVRVEANHAGAHIDIRQPDQGSSTHTSQSTGIDMGSERYGQDASRLAEQTPGQEQYLQTQADISVDIEIPRFEPSEAGFHDSRTSSAGVFGDTVHSAATADTASISAERGYPDVASSPAQVDTDRDRIGTLLAENQALQGHLRANKRKLSELSAQHLASSERILQLESELRTALASTSTASSTSSTTAASDSSSSLTTPHCPVELPQSQYEAYCTAVRLTETRSALLDARSRIERLELREKVAKEDRDVYKQRARWMEEEVKRVKAGWDGEVRRMMDAMAERGLLSRYEEAYHARSGTRNRPAADVRIGTKRTRSGASAAADSASVRDTHYSETLHTATESITGAGEYGMQDGRDGSSPHEGSGRSYLGGRDGGERYKRAHQA